MEDRAVVHVVLLDDVGGGGVDERREERARAAAVDEHFAGARRRAGLLCEGLESAHRARVLARERRCEPVEEKSLGGLDDGRRNVVPPECGEELAELSSRMGHQIAPLARRFSMAAEEYPSDRRTASVCSPSEGTAPIAGATPSRFAGGSVAATRPALVSTWRQRSRAASCGCATTSAMAFSRPLAIPAESSRATTSAAPRAANASSMRRVRSARFATRALLLEKRRSDRKSVV